MAWPRGVALVLTVVWIGVGGAVASAQSGLVLGIRELDDQGFRLSSAYLGVRVGPLIPLFSYDRAHARVSTTSELSFPGGAQGVTFTADLTAHIPAGGIKVLFGPTRQGRAVPYLYGLVGKPMLRVDLSLTGSLVSPSTEQAVEDLEQFLNDLVPEMWLFRGAIGGDYMISDSFAFSAEAGLQYLSTHSEFSQAVDANGDGWPDFSWRNALDTAFDMTFISVGFTFYF